MLGGLSASSTSSAPSEMSRPQVRIALSIAFIGVRHSSAVYVNFGSEREPRQLERGSDWYAKHYCDASYNRSILSLSQYAAMASFGSSISPCATRANRSS